ncbi:MAG: hypothetical protein Q9165_002305 [Trypethelium subeluteriae]
MAWNLLCVRLSIPVPKRRSHTQTATQPKRSKKQLLKSISGTVASELFQLCKINCLIFLCLICPPLAVFIVYGLHWRLAVNFLLTVLFWFPGYVNAIYALSQKGILTKHRHRRRNAGIMTLEERAVAKFKQYRKREKGESKPSATAESALLTAAESSPPTQLRIEEPMMS